MKIKEKVAESFWENSLILKSHKIFLFPSPPPHPHLNVSMWKRKYVVHVIAGSHILTKKKVSMRKLLTQRQKSGNKCLWEEQSQNRDCVKSEVLLI